MTWTSNGTVTVTNGSTTVTGANTTFVGSVLAGDAFIGPNGLPLEIAQVVSNTELELVNAYQGATAAGQSYTIMPTPGNLYDLATNTAELVNSFAAVRDGAGQGLFGDGTAAAPGIRFAGDQDTGIYRAGPNTIGFAAAGDEVCRLGPGGFNDLPVAGAISIGGHPAFSIVSGNQLYLGSESPAITTIRFRMGAINMMSLSAAAFTSTASDNVMSLGTPNARFSVLYAGTGTINTSDERAKTWRGALTAAEEQAGRALLDELGFYQFNDTIAEKGADGARYHFGVRAQQVWAAFAAQGLVDPIDETGRPGETKYGFLCFDEWEEETAPVLDADGQPTGATTVVRPAGFRYGIRPDELALFLIAVQAKRQAELEAEINSQAAAISSLQIAVAQLEAA